MRSSSAKHMSQMSISVEKFMGSACPQMTSAKHHLVDHTPWLFFFFFQAEEGIRDVAVTGVQTWCSSDLTLVGLDLVSVPQMMIARPLVAGPIAGAMLGDVATGLQLGVLFELFQYDILPMGATRYPE